MADTTAGDLGMDVRIVNLPGRCAIGSTVPCWVDPDRPGRLALDRGTSVAGVLFLVIMLGLTAVLFLLASRVGGC